MKEDKKMTCNGHSQKKSSLTLYLGIFILLIYSRLFDIYTTYLVTPNLTNESNFMVRYLGLGWFKFVVMNIVIVLVFFFLFSFSWSKFTKRCSINRGGNTPSFQEFENDVQYPKINKYPRSYAEHRNISLEIGIMLPIYVIITGYFQGVVNVMIHLKLIIVSFTNYSYLYPLIIGGIFGYISLFLTKKLLYLGHPRFTKKAHKIMMPKRTEEHEGSSKDPRLHGKPHSEEEVA